MVTSMCPISDTSKLRLKFWKAPRLLQLASDKAFYLISIFSYLIFSRENLLSSEYIYMEKLTFTGLDFMFPDIVVYDDDSISLSAFHVDL